MELSYELTVQDYLAFNSFDYAHDNATRRVIRKLKRWLAVVLFAILCLAHTGIVLVDIVLVLCCLLLFVWPVSAKMPYLLKKQLVSACENGMQAIGVFEVSIDPDGIHISTGSGGSVTDYRDIVKVMQDESHLYIYISSVQAIVIPYRAFSDENDRKSFLESLERRILDVKSERKL